MSPTVLLLLQILILSSLVSVCFSVSSSVIPTPDVHITFESASGNVLPGTPRDGTISAGSLSFEPGVTGNAAHFDSSTYVTFTKVGSECFYNIDMCPTGTDFTLSFWVQFPSLADSLTVFSNGGRINGVNGNIIRGVHFGIYNNMVEVAVQDATMRAVVQKPTSEFEVDVWYHVGITYDGAELVVALNGTTTAAAAASSSATVSTTQTFLGRRFMNDAFVGAFLVDEVKFWEDVLNPLDIYFTDIEYHCLDDNDCDATTEFCEDYRCRDIGSTCQVDRDCLDGQRCQSSFCLNNTYSCRTDADCKQNEHCLGRLCYPNHLHCDFDNHCDTSVPEHCVNYVCYVPGTPCFSDNHCPEEEYCADTICFNPADRCRDDNDCGLDKHCHDRRCYEDGLHCHDHNDCKEDGTHCYQGICYLNSVQCQVHEDCNPFYHCHDGQCYSNFYHCEEHSHCPAGDHCHDGVCHPDVLHCEDDDDCESKHHCEDDFCVADANHCHEGYYCPTGQHCHDRICYINELHCHGHEECGALHHCHEHICYLNSRHCHHDTDCKDPDHCIFGTCRELIDPNDLVEEEEPVGLNSRTLSVIVALSVTAGISLLSACVAVCLCLYRRPLSAGQTPQAGRKWNMSGQLSFDPLF